jgi:hypothetical protein
MANAATAAAPRLKNDWLLMPAATLALCWAGLEPEGDWGVLPPLVPDGEVPDGLGGVLPDWEPAA